MSGVEMLAESGVSLRRVETRVTEISAFRGKAESLAQALGLPPPGRFVVADGVTKIAYRPGCWVIFEALSDPSSGLRPPSPAGGEGASAGTFLPVHVLDVATGSPSPFAGEGARRADEGSLSLSVFADQAAIIDQSHGKHVLALEGPQARDLLMRGCRLDLRDAAFPAGSTGTSMIGQITVTLLCDVPGSAYRLIVGASFAEALADWLRRAAIHCPA